MSFRMECKLAVRDVLKRSSEEEKEAFDRAIGEIRKNWLAGRMVPNPRSPHVEQFRDCPFEYGVLRYQYEYDPEDVALHLTIVSWRKTRRSQ